MLWVIFNLLTISVRLTNILLEVKKILENKLLILDAFLYFSFLFLLLFVIYKYYALASLKANIDKNIQQGSQETTLLEKDELLKLAVKPTVTENDRKQIHLLAEKVGVSGNAIELNKCFRPSPLVLRVKLGDSISLNNSDDEKHVLEFSGRKIYVVEANQLLVIKADFGKGTGSFMYGCDGDRNKIGFIKLVK